MKNEWKGRVTIAGYDEDSKSRLVVLILNDDGTVTWRMKGKDD